MLVFFQFYNYSLVIATIFNGSTLKGKMVVEDISFLFKIWH